MNGEVWNDSLRGDYVWTSGNVAEAMPDVMTPCSWWAIQRTVSESVGPRFVTGHPYWGVIGGRFYLNLTVALSIAHRFRSTALFKELTEQGVGEILADAEVPLIGLPFWRSLREVGLREAGVHLGSVTRRRTTRRTAQVLPGACAQLRDDIARARSPEDLVILWHSRVEPLFSGCCALMRYARSEAMQQAITHQLLRSTIGTELTNAVTTGSAIDHLASLDLVVGLEQLAAGHIDRATFANSFGHRGPHEYELSLPRPGEDPRWIDMQLALLHDSGRSAERLLTTRAQQRDAAWREIGHRGRLVHARCRILARTWTHAARRRETLRSASIRGNWVLRTFVRRAGEITGAGEDLWFLSLDETLELLGGDRHPLDSVDERRDLVQRYALLPAYPTLIRGTFDPERWAQDNPTPDPSQSPPASLREPLSGWPGAQGVVHGTARVILDLDDADSFHPGEILVTPLTNVGWTPILLHATAIVTDIGAPLSHAAIVARELGIPAVVGCTGATTRIRTGDQLTVNGAKGTITWT